MLTTKSIISPEIKEYFSRTLLSQSLPGDNLKILEEIFIYIENKLFKKLNNLPDKKNKCEKLIKQFKDLYDITAAQEKEFKGKKTSKTEGPFYYIRMPTRRSEDLFRRLKYRSSFFSHLNRKNNEI